MSRVPRIRFKGFEEDWEQRKLINILSLLKDGTHGTHKDEMVGPLLLSAKNIKNGEVYYDETDRRISYNDFEKIHANFTLQLGDVLLTIVGSIGETALLRNPLGITFQRSVAFLRVTNKVMPEFLIAEINTNRFKNELENRKSTSAQPGIYLGDLGEIPVFMSRDLTEQQKIGTCFQSLDHLITLHQRKLEKLKIIKKSMLENLFPKNKEKTPRIRFSGFSEDWEQRKLGEIYTQLIERNVELLPYKRIISVSTMKYKLDGNGAAETSLSNYKRLRLGDIAFEGHTSKEFRYGRFVLNDIGDGIMSPRFSALRPINNMPIEFWKYYIHYEPIMKHILVNSTKSGTMMNELVVEEFLNEKLLVPVKLEQQKIGRCLQYLDHLITLHQSKLEKLQKIKKSMLESMFV